MQAWAIYQRLVLRLPYRVITQAVEDQFHVHVSESTIVASIRYFARDYAETEERCRRQLLRRPLIHADETKINRVWLLQDDSEVAGNGRFWRDGRRA